MLRVAASDHLGMTDLGRTNAELRAAIILAGKRIRRLNIACPLAPPQDLFVAAAPKAWLAPFNDLGPNSSYTYQSDFGDGIGDEIKRFLARISD
jgi:hypothetical protein